MGRLESAALALWLLVSWSSGSDSVIIPNTSRSVPARQTTVQVRFNPAAPAQVNHAAALAAMRRAVSTWNTALGSKLRLVEAAHNAPYPRGQLLVFFTLSQASGYFGPTSTELANTGTQVFRTRNYAVTFIIYNDTAAFAASSGFSTTGAPDKTMDLEIVTLHELGHALGMGHAAGTHVPPIMAPGLPDNKRLAQLTGKTVAQLRHLCPQDRQLLAKALQTRDDRRYRGKYTGSLEVTKVEQPTAPGKRKTVISTGHKTNYSGSDFELDDTSEKLTLTIKRSKAQVPVIRTLLGKPIEFTSFTPRRSMKSAEVEKIGATKLKVKLKMASRDATVTLTGELTKTP